MDINYLPDKGNGGKNQYRRQYPDLWVVHERERKAFFNWIETVEYVRKNGEFYKAPRCPICNKKLINGSFQAINTRQ